MKYASSGIGSTQHIVGEAFNLSTRDQGDPRALQGQQRRRTSTSSAASVEMMFDTTSVGDGPDQGRQVPPAGDHHAAPQRRAARRADAGRAGVRNADIQTWYALYVTAGTPRPVVERLAAELHRGAEAARRAGAHQGPGRRHRADDDRSSSPR
jgi:tripartite-type tricarboxylate transporter receptor subunit TctC